MTIKQYAGGAEEVFFAGPQTAWGTIKQPVAGEAIKIISSKMAYGEDREQRKDKRSTRSRLGTLTRRKKVTWSALTYLMTSGAAGTPPDVHDILNQFLAYTNTPSTSDVYAPVKVLDETVKPGLSLHRFDGHFHQACIDAIVNEMTIRIMGEGEAEIEFAGEAGDMIHTGSSTLNGALAGGEGSIDVQAGDGKKFSIGSVIDVGTSTGHVVDGVTVDNVSIADTITGAQSDGADVIPSEPSTTTAGTPLPGTIGDFQIDSVTVKVIECEIKVVEGLKIRNNEYGSKSASGFSSPARREVTITPTFWFSEARMKEYADSIAATQRDIMLQIGSAAGNKLVVDMNQVVFDPPEIDIPEEDEVTMQVTGHAEGSAGEDEYGMTYT